MARQIESSMLVASGRIQGFRLRGVVRRVCGFGFVVWGLDRCGGGIDLGFERMRWWNRFRVWTDAVVDTWS
jgi:hypothetical protein